jgi:sugar lactone lactonase YvrE
MRIYRITPDGKSSVFLEGAPLGRPNGVAIDNDGNIVVANMDNTAVMTFSRAAALLKTEHAAQAGSDGLVIMADGTKYVSSVLEGGVSKIRPGHIAELIATGIPNAASMCFDAGANQLVIPLNQTNGIAVVKLR